MAIGETILGAVLQVVFDKLTPQQLDGLTPQQLVEFFKSSKLDQALVNKLKHLLRVAENLLADAVQKQESDDHVKLWLDDLQHLFYRAEEIADQIATEAKRSSMGLSPEPKSSFGSKVWNLIPAFTNSSSFATTVNSQLSEVVVQLEDMVSHSIALNLAKGSAGVNTLSNRETTSYIQQDDYVFGRTQEIGELLKLLSISGETAKERIGVVAIVGMGGMGKTTLAKVLYNCEDLEIFVLKAWVYVSDRFDINGVIKSILESIRCRPYSGSLRLENLQHELVEELRGRKFFLVLDDVWNEDYQAWKSVFDLLTVGAHGSKIIVTTRNDKVASIMRTAPVVRLTPLFNEDGWLLFSKHAFEVGNLSSDPRFESLGRKIVDKCDGLPLAIKTLGGLLRAQEDIREWEAVLKSSLWDLHDTKYSVAPALRLSYYHLPSHLKQCFSYCSILPKGIMFDKEMLVLLWMAEDFVKPSHGRRVEDIGEDYLNNLLSCSFLERLGSCVYMHDLMHDLAEAVSGDFFARLEHEDKEQIISKKARYCSFSPDEFNVYSRFKGLHEANYLRTFASLELAESRCYLSNKVLASLIPRFCCLHTLSLSNYKFVELPESIVTLKQLRYLNVSRTRIKKLPESLSTLCNLQTLLLSGCSHLERLPADMSRLVSLRHLDISETTSLRQMPYHMSKLKCLQTLSDFVVGKQRGQGIEELRDLWHIRGKLALRGLQNISSTDAVIDVNLSGREYINYLALEFDEDDDSEKGRVVLENLKPHPNLEWLTIRNYPGTRFPSWLDIQCPMYKNIVELSLDGCKYCWLLPPLGQLPSLEYLDIGGMDHIKAIGPEFYAYDSGLANPFPVLRKLVIRDMVLWEEWWGHEMQERVPFPFLETLELGNCPELRGDLPAIVSSLKLLKIWGCESLESSQGSHVSTSDHRALRISFHVASTITELKLKGMKDLVSLPQEVGMLSCLQRMKLEECEKLESLENTRLPSNLGELKISKCKILKSLPKEMDLLNSLEFVTLTECPCLKSAPEDTLPTSLWLLRVEACEMWEFPIPEERMQCYSALTLLNLADIGGPLVSFPLGAFPNLQSLTLGSLRELETVYIPTEVDLVDLKSLESLVINACQKLKRIGKTDEEGVGVVNLPAPNLQYLTIVDCGLVKPLLYGDREGLPLKLQSLALDIDYLNRITRHRNDRTLCMFSSLRSLTIWNHLEKAFPDKGCVLPVSITTLNLVTFPNLENLNGEALKTLSSLQILLINECPKLECLPEEGLPPSLSRLDILGCPKLEERCQRNTGLDWPKIHHLPCVKINGKLI